MERRERRGAGEREVAGARGRVLRKFGYESYDISMNFKNMRCQARAPHRPGAPRRLTQQPKSCYVLFSALICLCPPATTTCVISTLSFPIFYLPLSLTLIIPTPPSLLIAVAIAARTFDIFETSFQ